jgi:hypothetical protein
VGFWQVPNILPFSADRGKDEAGLGNLSGLISLAAMENKMEADAST